MLGKRIGVVILGLGAFVLLRLAVWHQRDEDRSDASRSLTEHESPLVRAMMRSLRAQNGFDEFRAYGKSLPPSQDALAAGMMLSRQGLMRLSAQDQEGRLRIIVRRLHELPTVDCAAIAREEESGDKIGPLVGGMDSVTLAAFADIAARAVIAEVRDSPPARWPTRDDRQAFVSFVFSRLALSDSIRLERITENVASASDDEACWFLHVWYGAPLESPQPSRTGYLRVVSALAAEQPGP